MNIKNVRIHLSITFYLVEKSSSLAILQMIFPWQIIENVLNVEEWNPFQFAKLIWQFDTVFF